MDTYNSREKTGRRAGGQEGHKGTTLSKAQAEERIASGSGRHVVKNIGNVSAGKYISKYIMDVDIAPIITEIRIYADKSGRFNIPAEYRCDVAYGANIKSLAVALYSEGVMSNDRIAAFLNANFSIAKTVLYRAMKEKTIEAMKKIRFFKSILAFLCMTTKQRFIILGRDMRNAMYTSSGI